MRVGCDRQGPSWHITLSPHRGQEVTIDGPGLEALMAELEAAEADAESRVVVLRGTGGSFCSGMDLDELLSDPAAAPAGARRYAELLLRMGRFSKQLVAAVDGAAFGGGVGLAAAADVVVATEASVFGLPEVTLGLVPAMVLPVLCERLPRQKARRLCLAGASIDAAEAHRIGLCDELAADAAELDKIVKRVGRGARRAEPAAVATVKRFVRSLEGLPVDAGIEAGRELTASLLGDEAVIERLGKLR